VFEPDALQNEFALIGQFTSSSRFENGGCVTEAIHLQ
jgi:hypothetical protein